MGETAPNICEMFELILNRDWQVKCSEVGSTVVSAYIYIFIVWLRESMVAQWLAHMSLVLDVWGSTPLMARKGFGVRTGFP